ncbi:type II toxin -antitoxin system TacA 1-like antitoxin [Microseira wollei]|nr:DUF1778 domain-containing protein [Microseira wollei]
MLRFAFPPNSVKIRNLGALRRSAIASGEVLARSPSPTSITYFHFAQRSLKYNQSLCREEPETMSNPIQTTQTTTIEITMSQEQKEVLENAATIRSLSLSEYLLEVALKL